MGPTLAWPLLFSILDVSHSSSSPALTYGQPAPSQRSKAHGQQQSRMSPDAQNGGGKGTVLGNMGIQKYVTCSLGAWDAAELRNGWRGLPFC